MIGEDENTLTYSQRNGLEPIPPQLKLGEVSAELRRLLWYAVFRDFRDCHKNNVQSYTTVKGRWFDILRDLHVVFLNGMPERFNNEAQNHERALSESISKVDIGLLFDLIEYIAGHSKATPALRQEFAGAFVKSRAAYRLIDGATIIAVGTEEQASAILRACDKAVEFGASGARTHLIESGKALLNGDWAGSVRESIHAVEAIAIQCAPDKATLGSALNDIDRRGNLHPGLKSAFAKLYGFASDEEGVRHALVFQDQSTVDEADALFMLGSCASFVSYLIARQPSPE